MITTTQSNYSNHYNAFQLSLPLDLGIKINSDDEVVSFLKALEGVNLNKYLKRSECRGRKGYDNVMLLKVVLFARMIGFGDVRSMESLCKHDIRFMYIMKEETPSFMAFERLLKDYLIDDIDHIFFDISQNIGKLMNIDKTVQYIDGTKFEANANKYSFVYKTRIINARRKLFTKITEDIILLNNERGFDFQYHYFYCAQEVGYIVQYLMECIINNDIDLVYGKGKRKTDHDATMCATKIYYYCNTGLSRPCYNAQIGVSDGIIVNGDLFQRPADAGYGSYDNYMYCLTHRIELYMKYTMHAKKNETKFKKKKYTTLNWETTEEGYKICPNQHIFNKNIYDRYEDKGKYLRIIQRLESKESCEGCPSKNECCQNKRHQKVLSRDVALEGFYRGIDENLSTEFGKELKKQRSIQVEGAFGVIKQDMKFTRFTRGGLRNAKMEFLIVCIGYNLKKYHKYRLRKEKDIKQKELLN